ncbi:hypothetical protein RYX36_028012 [Vicia faba]
MNPSTAALSSHLQRPPFFTCYGSTLNPHLESSSITTMKIFSRMAYCHHTSSSLQLMDSTLKIPSSLLYPACRLNLSPSCLRQPKNFHRFSKPKMMTSEPENIG